MTAGRINCDVAVVGAGMVGAAAALGLARQGLEVAVLERRPPPPYPAGEWRLRVSALSLASEYLLRNLGVWDTVAAERITPYREMHVWDALGRASIHFDCVDLQQPRLGHIVENDRVQRALWEALEQAPGIRLLCPARLERADSHGRAALALEDGTRVTAELVVAADGAASRMRREAGIAVDRWRYRQRAVVAVVAPRASHRDTAWQRFLPGGPLAFLPLNDGRCSIVWSAAEAEAERLLDCGDAEFCDALTRASGGRLGVIDQCGPRASFALHYQHARHYVRPGLALIGDAAHVVHPLAGQGVNLGLLDAAALAGQLRPDRRRKAGAGSMKLLRRYERARRGDNLSMALAFDALNRLFGSSSPVLVSARNLGLEAAGRLAPLKRFFMEQATGLAHVHDALREPGAEESLLRPPEFQ